MTRTAEFSEVVDVEAPEVRRSLTLAHREVFPFAVMMGLTESFMVPYALALGATAFQTGLLTSVRTLVLSLAQLKSAEGVHWAGSRKRLVLITAGLQAILWIPLAFTAPLFGAWAVAALIVLYTLGMTSNAFGTPAWGSIISEYLRADDRGRFFGKRSLALGVGTTIAGLLAGAVLQATKGNPLVGFVFLCLAAGLARAVSWVMLTKLYDPPFEEPHESRLSFFEFLKRAPRDNFVRFTLLMSAMSFWTFVSSPYVSVYMLENLRYEYMTYSVVVLAGNLLGNLMIPRWGRIGDRHGNWVVMKWTFCGVALVPFLWAVSGHPVWLLFLFLLGGFLWGGLNLCSVNFVYDAASPAQRTRYLAYFNVINGLGISAGTFAGGLFLEGLPELAGARIWIALFLISGVGRLLVAVVFPRLVREVRSIQPVGLGRMTYDLVGNRVIQILGWWVLRDDERPRKWRRPGK